MYAELYAALRDHILTDETFKYVDLFAGQPDAWAESDKGPLIDPPAVFIEFDRLDWQPNGDGSYRANPARLSFYLCQWSLADSYSSSASAEEALTVLDNLHRLQRHLTGFSWYDPKLFYEDPDEVPEHADGAGMSPLVLQNTKIDSAYGGVIVHKIAYLCVIDDHSTRELSGAAYLPEPPNIVTEQLFSHQS